MSDMLLLQKSGLVVTPEECHVYSSELLSILRSAGVLCVVSQMVILPPIELGINFGWAQHMALLRSAESSVPAAINISLLWSD